MLLGAIADDFTGASDLANTLAKGGMATTLFVGPSASMADCDAGVVALKTRSIPPDEAVDQSLETARWLLQHGCEQILFKYCSTFDSTAEGNIGPVAEALLDFLGAGIAVVCPAFPATDRRLFMGHLFVGRRLLSESGMEHHPLTPMTDPDIRRWLSRQTTVTVGSIVLDEVRSAPAQLASAFDREMMAGHRLVVADAVADEDLFALGKAVASHKLVTGGSGIAMGLPQNFLDRGRLSAARPGLPAVAGKGVALCGSCSTASQAQVRYHLQKHPGLSIDPGALLDGRMTAEKAAAWVMDHDTAEPIVYSTASREAIASSQSDFGRTTVAQTVEEFFGDLARSLADAGMRRIVVGGGETSGAVVEALDLKELRIGEEIDPGVPVLICERNGPLGLALKSGNFGTSDFFEKALGKVGTA